RGAARSGGARARGAGWRRLASLPRRELQLLRYLGQLEDRVPVPAGRGRLQRLLEQRGSQFRASLTIGIVDVELPSADAHLLGTGLELFDPLASFGPRFRGQKQDYEFAGLHITPRCERVSGDHVAPLG